LFQAARCSGVRMLPIAFTSFDHCVLNEFGTFRSRSESRTSSFLLFSHA
jgi:hypothetical protein